MSPAERRRKRQENRKVYLRELALELLIVGTGVVFIIKHFAEAL